MPNIIDYVKWRGDLSFQKDPPNAADALTFSALAYIRYPIGPLGEASLPITLRDAADAFFRLDNLESRVRVKNDLELLRWVAASDRFGNARLCMYRDLYIPEQETQFAAMTFLLDDGSMFLAFRGTDSTLTGWKEDFNMTFQQTVPAQRLAVQYTREVALQYPYPIRMGGHSKGGNLAVFAAARSSPMIQSRILGIYNNDGPGFTQYLMGDLGYISMVPHIQTFIPQSSVIGMLLEHEEDYKVVKSTNISVLQHDPYSWEILGKDFVRMENVTEDSRFIDQTIKTWFAGMTNQERNQLVDVMFALLESGGADSVQDILTPKNIRIYLKALSSDAHLRHVLSREFQGLLEAARRSKMKLMQTDPNTYLLESAEETL